MAKKPKKAIALTPEQTARSNKLGVMIYGMSFPRLAADHADHAHHVCARNGSYAGMFYIGIFLGIV